MTAVVLFAVFFPFLAGALNFAFPQIRAKTRNIYTFTVSLINLAAVIAVCIGNRELFTRMAVQGSESAGGAGTKLITLISFTDRLVLSFRIDGFGLLFALLVAVLWPFSLLYAYEYMEHDKRQSVFFTFFMMTLGSVLGIAFSADLFSLYIFYEILTLVTFPLVMHEMTPAALSAGRKYLVYMLGGAAFAFVGMVVVMNYSSTLVFTKGGVLNASATSESGLLLLIFFITFMGFSVKAAMMPFSKWLIDAAVAPMPVTGLLHAVAVVKAGAFACIRLIYYIYGTDFLKGTWPQYALIAISAVTIVSASGMAIKELHLKRRLAYSTISNLSYVLFGALLMSPMGFKASLTHLVMHAVAKIGLFFCIGAMMHTNNKVYQYEIDNIGRKMKYTFAAFTICGMSLIGIPQFGGFISKMRLLDAVIDNGEPMAYIGGGALILSALFTAIYLLTTVIRAFFPVDGACCSGYEDLREAGVKMLVPIYFSVIMSVVLGIFWQPLLDFIGKI